MDGVVDASDYIKQAIEWGHKAIAITDHGVVQAYPDANNASKGKEIKVIYVEKIRNNVRYITSKNIDEFINRFCYN